MSRRWPLLLGALWLAIAAVRPGASSQELPAAAPPRVLPGPELHRPQLQGAGSCAAAACHNGPGIGMQGREYALALERDIGDPRQRVKDLHAQAYEVLFEPLARKIELALHPKALPPRPETDALCLRCHVHPHFDYPPHVRDGAAQFRLEDGVSCEACHGPAERWLASHFRTSSPTDPRALGQADTRSLPGRIRLCALCHVGAAGMDVNHDLIAAGHPRLGFEFASFHFLLHKHWDYAKDRDPFADPRGRRDFEARAWLLGQLISARAALALLADRAADRERPWPEFAEYDCASCHHDLQDRASPRTRLREPRASQAVGSPLARASASAGSPRLMPSDWYTSLLPDAFAGLDVPYDAAVRDALRTVRAAMDTNRPDRRQVAETARRAVAMLDQRLAGVNDRPAAPIPVDALLGRIARNARTQATHSYDETAQLYLAIHALRRARHDMGMPLAPLALPKVRGLLQFPPAAAESAMLTPAGLRATLDAISRMEPR